MGKRTSTWIIDGHNVIFAVPELERLQDSQRKREARDALLAACRSFAAGRGERVVVIFDGVPGFTEGAEDGGWVEAAFASYAGKADDMIVFRAQQLIDAGSRVTVATDDRDLRSRLHKNAAAVDSRGFWQLTRPKRKPTGEEIPRIPLDDVEAIFLENEAAVLEELAALSDQDTGKGRIPDPKRPPKPPAPPRPPDPPKPPRPPKPPKPDPERDPNPPQPPIPKVPGRRKKPTEEPSAEERLRQKKERGRRKQARRLARSKKKARGSRG